MKRIFSFIMIPVLAAALISCWKEPAKPARPVVASQAGKAAPPERVKSAATPSKQEEKKVETEPYIYDPKGRRDPFLSIIESSKKEREAERKKSGRPSESFEVSDIRVIAIAWEKNRYFAMVQLPDKKYYTVREGMTLGLYGGKIIKIDQTSITVREFIKNYKGEVQPKDTILRLRKEEGE